MRPLPDSPGFTANSEVDKVKWMSPRQLLDKLSHEPGPSSSRGPTSRSWLKPETCTCSGTPPPENAPGGRAG